MTKEPEAIHISNESFSPSENSTPEKSEVKSNEPFFSWPRIAAIAVPAYVYFFGYASFKFKLEHMGFDSPNTSTAAGEVYFNAMNAFLFIAMKVIPKTGEILIQALWSLLPVLAASIILVIAAYYLQHYVAKRKEATSIKTPQAMNPSRLYFHKAVGIAAFTNGVAVLSVPAVVSIIFLMALVLLPPPLIGIYMGSDELESFDCPAIATDEKAKAPCSKIFLEV